ncbi:MAG: zinc-binding alcohol dehydrogenase family protein [Devosia sp.]
MEAAVFSAPFELAMAQRERPQPGPGEALVRVDAAGLCAGDLYIYLGKNPYVSYPRIGGHEIAGHVEALGPETVGPKAGTRVVVEPFLGCGHCYPCRVGKPNCCANLRIIGAHQDGGFADYVIAPVEKLFTIPDGMSAYKASFTEPVAIGVQSCRRGQVSADDTVLILGAGPIGLALVEVANARGAKTYITDVLPERLETAASLGATPIAAGDGLLDEVMRITNGEGMPVVIEATGVPQVMERTVDYVAAGGRIVIVGLVKKGTGVTFPGLDFTRKEMTIVGSRASTACFPESLELIASGKIRYPDIGTEFALREAPGVFAKLADNPGALHKAVFVTG